MRYAILIHSDPQPWGHPSTIFTDEGRAVPAAQHEQMDREFDALLAELSASGEFVTALPMGDPAESTIYTWSPSGRTGQPGRYAGAQVPLAGYFIIDCASRERAEQVAEQFAGPGTVAELRPVAD